MRQSGTQRVYSAHETLAAARAARGNPHSAEIVRSELLAGLSRISRAGRDALRATGGWEVQS